MSLEASSRRSQRNVSHRLKAAALVASALVLALGLASLDCAVDDARSSPAADEGPAVETAAPAVQDEPASTSEAPAADAAVDVPEQDDPAEDGAAEGSRASADAGAGAGADADSAQSAESDAKPSARKAEKSREKSADAGAAKTSRKKAKQKQKRQKQAEKTVVHHTAYRREAVYRTVQHKAVEVTRRKGSATTVARGPCPVCGERHAHDFTERVFDHYVEHFCEACGKKHAKAYDEQR